MLLHEHIEKFIRTHELSPLIEIVEYNRGAPCSKQELDTIEKDRGIVLSESVKQFYQLNNGLRFHWKLRPGMADEAAYSFFNKNNITDAAYPEDSENPLSKIDLLPLTACFVSNEWMRSPSYDQEEQTSFAGHDVSYNEFVKRLIPFDIFSGFSCMAFLLDETGKADRVLQLTNHYDDWRSSRLGRFDDYLLVLQYSYGLACRRSMIYAEMDGDTRPDLTKEEIAAKLYQHHLLF